LAATSAFAQVTMYGSIDVANVTKTHSTAAGAQVSKTTGIGEGFNAGNRIGFRGNEDLGGGMTTGFVIEQGLNITNGQLFSSRAAAGGQQVDGVSASGNMPGGAYSTGTSRQAFVSLADSNMGEVRAGYQYTALYTVSTNSGYHLGSEQPGGDMAHGTLNNADFGGTRANGLTYISPRFSGVQVTLQKGAGSGREDVTFSTQAGAPSNRITDKNNRQSILLNYTAGPLNASYAHTSMKIEQSAATTGAFPITIFGSLSATAYTAASGAAKNQSNTLDQLAGSYTLGALKLAAHYSKGKIDDSATTANSLDTKATQIGAEYTMGKFRPFAISGNSTNVLKSSGATTFDAKSSMYGARYDLSKRTLAYVMSGKVTDSGTLNAAAATTIAERKATAIGLYHSF